MPNSLRNRSTQSLVYVVPIAFALAFTPQAVLEERKPAGPHSVTWDGTDEAGRNVGSGTHLIRMQSDGEVRHQKVTLVR